MTLARTRPILQDELRQYELHHRARIAIKPGITGMWQVTVTMIKRRRYIIRQQSSHIELLEKANETLQKQLETGQKQLEILQDIFASGEDGVQVEKELMNLIKKEIDETHPLWEYVKDKGGDIAVAGATAGIPVLYGAFKAYLLSKGIMLP